MNAAPNAGWRFAAAKPGFATSAGPARRMRPAAAPAAVRQARTSGHWPSAIGRKDSSAGVARSSL